MMGVATASTCLESRPLQITLVGTPSPPWPHSGSGCSRSSIHADSISSLLRWKISAAMGLAKMIDSPWTTKAASLAFSRISRHIFSEVIRASLASLRRLRTAAEEPKATSTLPEAFKTVSAEASLWMVSFTLIAASSTIGTAEPPSPFILRQTSEALAVLFLPHGTSEVFGSPPLPQFAKCAIPRPPTPSPYRPGYFPIRPPEQIAIRKVIFPLRNSSS